MRSVLTATINIYIVLYTIPNYITYERTLHYFVDIILIVFIVYLLFELTLMSDHAIETAAIACSILDVSRVTKQK